MFGFMSKRKLRTKIEEQKDECLEEINKFLDAARECESVDELESQERYFGVAMKYRDRYEALKELEMELFN